MPSRTIPLVKCLICDLDNTLWHGTLLEAGSCRLRSGVREVLSTLDHRGVLLSIASANDGAEAIHMLEKRGLTHLFLHPQIGWGSKVAAIQTIARKLSIALDAIAFVDDEPFELERVRHLLPDVRTFPASDFLTLPQRPEFQPPFDTRESRRRRRTYVQAAQRREAQRRLGMKQREFARWCNTEITIRPAQDRDRNRILELLHRTHQLNATGRVYGQAQVQRFLSHRRHRVFVADLKDRFVDYGTIAAAICACNGTSWRIISFVLSCRVLGRGVGGVLLNWLSCRAAHEGMSTLEGLFVPAARNRRMRVLFTLSGFKLSERADHGALIFSRACGPQFKPPEWITVFERGAA
jgi:FkbH-like protein